MPDNFRSHLHSVDIGSDPATGASSGGDGGGRGFDARLAALETHFEYLATKEQIKDVEGQIKDLKIWILASLLGGIPVATLLVLGIIKFFEKSPN